MMKAIKVFTIILISSYTLWACSDDDNNSEDASCSQADYLGEYLGIANCLSPNDRDDVPFNIVAVSSDSVEVHYTLDEDGVDVDITIGPFLATSCSGQISGSESGYSVEANYSLNGSMFDYQATIRSED